MVGAGLRRLTRSAAGSGLAALALVTAIGAMPDGAAWANGKFPGDGIIELKDPGLVHRIRIPLNKSTTLQTDRPFQEALLPINPSPIVDVVTLTDQRIYLVGQGVGMTRLTILDSEKRLLGIVELEVSYDVDAVREELARSVPGGEFRIKTANGRILLGGSVPDAIALSKAVAITEQFCGGGSNSKDNQVREFLGAPADKELSGAQVDAARKAIAGPYRGLGGPDGNSSRCFVNSLVVRAPQQVLLEVRFVEAVRTAERDLGLSWDTGANRFRGLTGAAPVPITPGLLTSRALLTGFPSSSVPFGTFVARLLDNGTQADLIVEALEKRGLARRLAEPNLVVLSGDTANFLAGGEFPFPVQADEGRITVEFKKFGVGLAFTPTVLADSQINLKIEPEVSDIDPNNAFALVNGISVPALVVRRASTTVELRDGQSFAVAGLLQTKHTKDLKQLPWLGNVPVLGALFRSASYEKEESDLVIIVTPRLVRPAVPGQKLLTPLDQKLAGNDRDYFVRGRAEVPKHFPAPYGHVLDVHGEWAPTTLREVDHASYK
jgi:pilus assembly protein CpaC